MADAVARARIRGLYAIADTAIVPADRLFESVAQAIAGGARTVQYRDKAREDAYGAERERRLDQATRLASICRAGSAVFIVNDDIALARAVAADGVHLGRDDPPLEHARAELGEAALIGVSCYNAFDRALAAESAGADYVAFGSFYPSSVKPGAARADVELLQAGRERLRIPRVAIGGITPENGARLIAAGADALAVITGLFGQRDVRAAAQRYAQLFESAHD